ncbi:MAG: Wadjet anti-phage system protein JetD domain-containing protein [Bullifex sp.]
MLTPDEIKTKAIRKWPVYRDHLVRTLTGCESTPFFPLTIRGDTSLMDTYSESAEAYTRLYGQSKEKKGKGYTLIWEKRNIRGYGSQSEIKTVLIETEEDYLFLTGKDDTHKAITKCITCLNPLFSDRNSLYLWSRSHAKETEAEGTDWKAVRETLSYFLAHRDNHEYYMRELPIKVHTKFIEENSALLISLFSSLTGKTFLSKKPEDVFRLKRKPLLIRLRMKAERWEREETALPLTSFSHLDEEEDLSMIRRVFIIENEAVYLSFPVTGEDICVFGGGFQAAVIDAPWIRSRKLYYFGDLDEHGLQILSVFRRKYPETESLMMDAETYLSFREYSVAGVPVESENAFSLLTESELSLLSTLRENAPDHSRLEQERIPQEYIRHIAGNLS